VFVGQAFRTFQLDRQRVLYNEIRKILTHSVPFVDNGKKGFRGRPDASQAQLSQQSALVNLLEKSRAQRVGDLEHGVQHLLAQRIQAGVICVHLPLSAAYRIDRQSSPRTVEPQMNADKRR
jgi:hypothetical protein